MSFRLRLTLLASLAVAVAIVGASLAVYYTDKHELIAQVDADLSASKTLPRVSLLLGPAPSFRPANVAWTLLKKHPPATGAQIRSTSRLFVLPRSLTAVRVSIHPQQVKSAARPPSFSTQRIGGVRTRVLTLDRPSEKILISRSLVEVDRNLAHLRWLLLVISLGGIGAAVVLGAFVSSRAVAPLRRLTETTERIVETGDLSRRIGHRGRDEISRLSRRLDELLGTLDASLSAQRQLVADASHELRTPIATLRANFELLANPGALDEHERAELLSDAGSELESMTTLVGELVELARGEERDAFAREFRLDEVVKGAVERAARRSPALAFRTRLEPSLIVGVPERVDRAVANLLDNARKWSPAGSTVDVEVRDGLVEVRDHGPGIASEDRPLVFNRFYRSAAARGMPGAGLGLAIVKQIAEAHGGTVAVDGEPGGGAILRLSFLEPLSQ